MEEKRIRQEIQELTESLNRLDRAYYVEGKPLVSDREYDRLFLRLSELEQAYPHLKMKDTPTSRVGSDLSSDLPEAEHQIPVLSLDKAYTPSAVTEWMQKTDRKASRELSFVAEEKIDGVAIVLYYREGVLDRAVTRGNGYVGNDVTGNVRTIRQVPLRLAEPADITVRGEIFLTKSDFRHIAETQEIEYANPRNLAAGSIRRVKSREAAAVPLQICIYEGYTAVGSKETHVEMLQYLAHLGFPLSRHIGVFFPAGKQQPVQAEGFSHWWVDTHEGLESYIHEAAANRDAKDYEIDGLVIKVNELQVRNELGYTGHHPRWAVAYKFESLVAETVIEQIEVQVGRTGRITPVARVHPAKIGGSVVSNVTLHNQDFIRMLEIAPGDTVAVSKRGDVIPAVERVVEKSPSAAPYWKLPSSCPSCEGTLTQRGAHLFCENLQCPQQVFERIRFFCSKKQMDIEGFGPETIKVLIDLGVLQDIPDMYEIDFEQTLAEVPGFGRKKIRQLQRAVHKSREKPFQVVLASLGIPEIGHAAAELLVEAGFSDIDSIIETIDRRETYKFEHIKGFGKSMAQSLAHALGDPAMRRRITRLKDAGLSFSGVRSDAEENDQRFAGQQWCVTGSFEHFSPRSQAEECIKKHGGKLVSAVSRNTTHLLAGASPGSKLEKAKELGVTVVTEEEFIRMLE